MGATCNETCPAGSYGALCGGHCACDVGHTCHHVTGDCLRCGNDNYGKDCLQTCDCSKNGTALCSHVDGRCFCEGNYFGDKCQLHCPFGYLQTTGCLQKLEVNKTLTQSLKGSKVSSFQIVILILPLNVLNFRKRSLPNLLLPSSKEPFFRTPRARVPQMSGNVTLSLVACVPRVRIVALRRLMDKRSRLVMSRLWMTSPHPPTQESLWPLSSV